MSLVTQLGLEPGGYLLETATRRWSLWQTTHCELAVCEGLEDLPRWMGAASKGEQNAVLLTLARMGAADGEDDPIAASVLIWLLLPGATRVACSLAPVSDRIDELVAAQLWICVRTVSWRKPLQVAATILMNTRREVQEDLFGRDLEQAREIPTQVIEDLAVTVGATSARSAWQDADPAADRFYDLLEAAVTGRVVTREEARILVRLSEVSHEVDARTGRGWGGLLGRDVAQRVATEAGMSRATVSRRAQEALVRLQRATASQNRNLLSA